MSSRPGDHYRRQRRLPLRSGRSSLEATPLKRLELERLIAANNSRRQVKSWPGAMSCARATCDTVQFGRADSATIRSFASRLQRRRRSTDVITSTVAIVPCLLSQ
jgi:hypothetical protein